MKANGYILYEGPSMLDGQPIVCIATGLKSGSANAKTGAMVQTWILRSDISPRAAVNTGEDVSICGDCPHRGRDGKGRTCYVRIDNAPRAIWAAYADGRYSRASDLRALMAGRKLRIGSYGDPAAVPINVWRECTARARAWTGYTHQWRTAQHLAPYCMASADGLQDRALAKLAGFRTFRVRGSSDYVKPHEVQCPASAEMGHKTSCDACLLCMGATSKARRDVTIIAHGAVSLAVRVDGVG